jgi:hypothetical protein
LDDEEKAMPDGKVNVPAAVTTEERQRGHLDPLANYITGLWKVGGLPLLMIGLGAANLFVPSGSVYTETKQFVITGFLFASGVVAWASLILLAFKRWQSELKHAIQQDAQVIEAVVRLVEGVKSDAAARERVKILTESLESLRVAKVPPLALPSGGGTTPE